MGSPRFTRWSDLLPWRYCSSPVHWAPRNHPYFSHYVGHQRLIELASQHNVSRFVRLHGAVLGLSSFHPATILFNLLLSFVIQYNAMTERFLHTSGVPYVILRPGGLSREPRNVATTNIQVDASGRLPLPCRIGDADVAALAVQSITQLPANSPRSFVLACRWCGTGVKPQAQGKLSDPTAARCLQALIQSRASSPVPARRRPYRLAGALTLYGLLAALVFRVRSMLLRMTRLLM